MTHSGICVRTMGLFSLPKSPPNNTVSLEDEEVKAGGLWLYQVEERTEEGTEE